jgi:ATP-dependent protease ClpP protease subunit
MPKLVNPQKPNGKNWFPQNVKSDIDTTEIMVYDVIGWDVMPADFIEQLNNVQTNRVHLRINSPGGYMFDGFAIYSHLLEMQRNGKTVVATIDAIAASMASVIAMAASEISMPDTSMIMIHKPLVFTGGNADDLRKEADVLDKLEDSAVKAYKRHAKGIDDSAIRDMLRAETWLTADEAVGMGFAEKIIPSIEEDPANVSNLNFTAEMALKAMKCGCVINWGTADSEGAKKAAERMEKKFPPKVEAPAKKPENNAPPKTNTSTGGKAMKYDEFGNLVDENGVILMTAAEILAKKNVDPKMVEAHKKEVAEARKQASEEAATTERTRINEIRALGQKMAVPADDIDKAITEGKEIDAVRADFIDRFLNGTQPQGAGHVAGSVDEVDKIRNGLTTAILCRGDILSPDDPLRAENRKSEFAGFGGQQAVREILMRAGYPRISNMSNAELGKAYADFMSGSWCPQAVTGINSQTLASVLTDSVNASLLRGMQTANTTYQMLTGVGDLNDLKLAELYAESEAADIKKAGEGQVAEDSQISDEKETTQLEKYMRSFSYTEEAVINDRLNVLTDVPMKMGRSVERKKEQLFYSQILSATGPTLVRDAGSFFSSAHGNALGALDLTKDNMAAGVKSMFSQKHFSPDGSRSADIYLSMAPRFLITGPDMMVDATDITTNVFEPNVAQNPQIKNVFGPGGKWALLPIASPEFLRTSGASKFWLMSADPMEYDACKVYYLAGRQAPEVTSKVGGAGEVQGVLFQIKTWFVVKFLDYRPYVRSTYAG